MFGHDALKSRLSTRLKQSSAIAVELIAELNAALLVPPDQLLQPGSTLDKSLLAKVLAVEMQQIEGIEDDAVGPLSKG